MPTNTQTHHIHTCVHTRKKKKTRTRRASRWATRTEKHKMWMIRTHTLCVSSIARARHTRVDAIMMVLVFTSLHNHETEHMIFSYNKIVQTYMQNGK